MQCVEEKSCLEDVDEAALGRAWLLVARGQLRGLGLASDGLCVIAQSNSLIRNEYARAELEVLHPTASL